MISTTLAGTPAKSSRLGSLDVVGVRQFVGPRSDVELNAAEPLVGQPRFYVCSPGHVLSALRHPLRHADGENESIARSVDGEDLDEALVQ